MPKWTEQQRDAIADRGHSLIVCAAAVSGKTSLLVERIVQLVREGRRARKRVPGRVGPRALRRDARRLARPLAPVAAVRHAQEHTLRLHLHVVLVADRRSLLCARVCVCNRESMSKSERE